MCDATAPSILQGPFNSSDLDYKPTLVHESTATLTATPTQTTISSRISSSTIPLSSASPMSSSVTRKATLSTPSPTPTSVPSNPGNWVLRDFTGADTTLASLSVARSTYGEANRAIVPDPDSTSNDMVLRIKYPQGSYKPSGPIVGGTGLYATPLNLATAKTVTMEMQVFFPEGFQFVLGGKLPGLYGGHESCSGGNDATGCFSTRFMWRTDGLGEAYLYLVDQQVPGFCAVPPKTVCNPQYGTSLGRGAWTFATGKWNTLSQTVTLNTVGQSNGKILVKFNGNTVLSFDQIVWRVSDFGFIGLQFETFFGDLTCGADCQWKCPYGFPCITGLDCITNACIGNYCDAASSGGSGGGGGGSGGGGGGGGGPVGQVWSLPSFTSQDLGAFKVTKDSYGAENRNWVSDPSGGGVVLQIKYPAHSFNPSNNPVGGTGFYAVPVDLSKATSVTFQYDIWFPNGFNFVQGGKLPGLYGGHPSCTGGNVAADCFSTRFMFRTDGLGEIYLYVDLADQLPSFCQVPPRSFCNGVYGNSIGRGAWSWSTGSWNTISQTITLNTPGVNNGVVQVSFNGVSVINYGNVAWRTTGSVGFVGIDFETFFGGNDASWATPVDQYVDFKGFMIKINS
eukprot:jgi/Hompol1/937/HPOL_001073-RA